MNPRDLTLGAIPSRGGDLDDGYIVPSRTRRRCRNSSSRSVRTSFLTFSLPPFPASCFPAGLRCDEIRQDRLFTPKTSRSLRVACSVGVIETVR